MRTRVSHKNCERCGEEFLPRSSRPNTRKFCSRSCSGKSKKGMEGENAMRWKGGKRLNAKGYVDVWIPPEERERRGQKRKYVLEHRLVMENHLGRPLLPTEQVHHKNGVRHDNRLENLELWDKGHSLPGVRSGDVQPCPLCNGTGVCP